MSVEEFLKDAIETGFDIDNYKCEKCGVSGVRMFRSYSTFHITLLCHQCSVIEQGKDYDGEASIGWRVAAVPYGDSWWGYTSVPQDGCDWWYGLPDERSL